MSEWKEYTIGEICSRFSSGKSIKASQISAEGLYPVYGGNGLRGFTDTFNFDGECSIIGRQGAYCGNVRYFKGKAFMTEHAIVAVVNENHNNGYVSNLLSMMNLAQYQGQSAQPGLSVSTLSKIIIKLPDLATQEQCFNVLNLIDQKIQINNQINRELEDMAKTLYDYWFVQFDFPDQNGKPYKSSGGKMVYKQDLKREIPEGWGVESVGNLLDKVTKAEKIENNSIEFVGRIPVIDQSQKYIAGFTNNQNSLIQPQNGHVIFGDHTRVVKFINFDYARGADGTQVLISNNENISNILLYHMIEDFDLSNYGYARHFKFLKEKLVIVPDKKISLQFANKADVIYKKIRNNIFENQELTQLRDWLLPMLMNGQVKVE